MNIDFGATADLIPLREWCAKNSIPISTAYLERKKGRLAVTYIGTKPYLSRGDIEAFIKVCKKRGARSGHDAAK